MMRCATLLFAAAVLCMGAAPAQKPAAKSAAKAAPKPTAPAGPFDPQSPQSLIAMLAPMGAQASVTGNIEDTVMLKVTTPAYAFNAQFAGCDRQGRKCKAVAFEAQSDQRTATIAELNAFNQTSLTCKAWQAKDGKPHVMYAALVSAADSRSEFEAHLGAWQGCLADFGIFLKEPKAYLATAP